MNKIKYYVLGTLITTGLLVSGFALSAPQNRGNVVRNITPEADITYYNGSTTRRWLETYSKTFCIGSSDCITAWSDVPATVDTLGQVGDVTTTTPVNYGDLLIYDATNSNWENIATSTLLINTDDTVEGATNLYYTQARTWDDMVASSTYPAFVNYWTKTGTELSYNGFTTDGGNATTSGELVVNTKNVGDYFDFYNGSFLESFDALVTSDGATVTMTLTNACDGASDLTTRFSSGDATLPTSGSETIALTAGTNASPQSNYIYILQTDPSTLVKSTSGFPTTVEHIKVSYFFVPSAAYVASDGTYINQNWNDHAEDCNQQGHMPHTGEVIRYGTGYWSGLDENGIDQAPVTSYFDYVGAMESYFKSAAGVTYQFHRHALPAFDSRVGSGDIHVVNYSGDNYHGIHNLADIQGDSASSTLSNKYFNVFFFAVGNKGGEYSPLMAQLPSGSYVSQTSAENDVDGFDNLTMPREFIHESTTGVPIARLTLRWSGGLSTLTHISTKDCRGGLCGTGASGTGGSQHDFADNQFTIFDEADDTRIGMFDLGEVTTGNTRTITWPDYDFNWNSPVFPNGTTTDSWFVGGYASSTVGFNTQGSSHIGTNLALEGSLTSYWGAACGAGDFVNDIADDGTLSCGTPAGGGGYLLDQWLDTTSSAQFVNGVFTGYASSTVALNTQGTGHFGGEVTIDGNLGIGGTPTENFSIFADNKLIDTTDAETDIARLQDTFVTDTAVSNFYVKNRRIDDTGTGNWQHSALRLENNIDDNTSAQTWIEFQHPSSNVADNTIAFGEGSTDANTWMVIDNGSVGIGTITPGNALDIIGSASTSLHLLATGHASTTAGLFTQGNLRIGGTSLLDGNATTTGHHTITDGTNGVIITPGATTTFEGF